MSLESATEFFKAMVEDEDVRDLVLGATEGKESVDRASVLVSVGAERGFDFTAEEAEEIRLMVTQMVELSDDDLEQIAGGGGISGQETLRNQRQTGSTSFQSANQKANQYMNMLSSVLKTQNETMTSILRNIR